MEISVSDALGPSASGANDGPHRRATVDARPARPKPGILLRRPSLPLRNKSVRFAPLSDVWEYPPSPEWMTWHKPRDQERFREQRTIDALAILGRPPSATTEAPPSCPVGLKHLLSGRSASGSVRAVVRSVLAEQLWQRLRGVREVGRVRHASSALMAAARELARGRGRFHEVHAASVE